MKNAILDSLRLEFRDVLLLACAILLASIWVPVASAQDVIEASMQVMESDPDLEPCEYGSDGVDSMPTDCADASVHEQKIDLMLEAAAVESELQPAEFPDDVQQGQPPAGAAPSDTFVATPEVTATVPADSFAAPEVTAP